MAITIRDVAERSGFSRSTVSLALNDRRDVSLPEPTRQRILQAAAELGYRPNGLARALRRGRSSILGAIVWHATGRWDAHLLEGMAAQASRADYRVMLGCSRDDPAVERDLIESFRSHEIEGLAVAPVHQGSNSNADLYRRLQDAGVRLVFVGEPGPLPADLVETDHRRGGYLAGRHLAERGAQRVVYLAGERLRKLHWCRLREAGCAQALQEGGGATFNRLLIPRQYLSPPEGLAATLARALESGEPFDAIFASYDDVALPALAALAELGVRVPEEVMVVGFDDLAAAAHSTPALTTVAGPMEQIGAEGVRLLLGRISGSLDSPEPLHLTLEPTLVVRESTGRE